MQNKQKRFKGFSETFPLKLKYPITVIGAFCVAFMLMCELGIFKNRHPRPIVYVYWLVCITAEIIITLFKKKHTTNNPTPPA